MGDLHERRRDEWPYHCPCTVGTQRQLTRHQQDSVIAFMLGPEGRQDIVRVLGGFQYTSDFRDVNGTLPLLRLEDPNDKRQIIDVSSLRMTAQPFRPPAVRVVDVRESGSSVSMIRCTFTTSKPH